MVSSGFSRYTRIMSVKGNASVDLRLFLPQGCYMRVYDPKYRGKGKDWAKGIKNKQWGYAGRITVPEELTPCPVRYICVKCFKGTQVQNKLCGDCQ